MPKIEVNGAELFYDEAGSGSETIVFAHSLLFSCRMFDEQISALKDRYRCITFDFRGQGESQVTSNGYDMDSLYEDAVELIERLNCAPCHFVGFSMGGFIAIRLAVRRPDLIKSLILIDTSAEPEPKKNLRKYQLLNLIARRVGPWAVARHVMPIMFSQKFLRDPERVEQRRKWRQQLVANDRIGVTRAVTGVITRQGVYDQLDKIKIPTLIIVGENDVATPPEMSERMQTRIPDARLVIISAAGHMTPIEQPGAMNAVLEEFLNSLS
jgi:pimeloyl-ACP methyl ester carboxylesterase